MIRICNTSSAAGRKPLNAPFGFEGGCESTIVTVYEGRIRSAGYAGAGAGDLTVTPGLIDIHTHGIGPYSYETPEGILEGSKRLPQYGVTSFLPTMVPNTADKNLLNHLSVLASTLDRVEAVNVPGLHLEGPFVAVGGAACVLRDGDTGLLSDLISACNSRVAAMSVAPDVKNIIPVIEWLVERNIVPFMTHTRADVEQTLRAVDAGARHATHFYDVFYPPEANDGGVRPVGCVETVLADPRCTVDFICDGVHVHPMAIRAALAAKGPENLILATDSNIGAGLPPGVHETPWGYPVRTALGMGARVESPGHPRHGRLAGSTLTMDQGINNLMAWLDLPAEKIWAMGSANSARLLNLHTKGRLQEGFDADLVVWRKDAAGNYRAAATFVAGRKVFHNEAVDINQVVRFGDK